MRLIEGFEFFPLTFNDEGRLESGQEYAALLERAGSGPASDAIFLAHGFRNDVSDATNLYTRFLTTFRAHLARPEFKDLTARRFVVVGVYWPSKPFRESFDNTPAGTRSLGSDGQAMATATTQLEELKTDASPSEARKLDKAMRLLPTLEGNPAKQDEFVALVLSVINEADDDQTEGLPRIRQRPGSELLARLSPPAGDGTRGIGDVLGAIGGGVGRFLNLTLWYVMKDRSGKVGATGVAAAVRALHARGPAIRIHLVGHSLGGRLMASCAKALCDSPMYRPDSLMLLEAAFSHFGFSPDNGRGHAGFFRTVIEKQVVKGPFLSTFSTDDTVVGNAYAIMSRLAGDNTREIGDASDEFGGLGRNGPLRTTEIRNLPFRTPGTAYDYTPGIITNLDGSGGWIKNHSDVTNEAVTYAFASAIRHT